MSIFTDSRDILTDVLTNKKTFSSALNAFLQLNVRSTEELSMINHIYNGFFSKYYYFEEVTKESLSKSTNLLIATVGVAFVSLKDLKLSIDDVLPFVSDTFDKNKEDLTEDFKNSLIAYKNGKDFTFKNIETGSIEHLSILFNLPTWFVSMIVAQKGKEEAKEIFKSFLTKQNKSYFIRNSLTNLNELPKEELYKFKSDEKVIYTTNDKRSPLLNNFTFIKTNPNYENVFAKLPKFNNKYLTIYEADHNNFYFRFLNEYLFKNNVINIAMKSINKNPEVLKEVALREIKDTFIYESTVGELIARLSFKQDCLFFLPHSTNMTKFFEEPEYRVLFDISTLDQIIKDDEKDLREISSYVENRSYLVYLVDTIDKKETSKLISDFVKENKEFSIVEEKEILPTKENKSFVYYCILKRVIHA